MKKTYLVMFICHEGTNPVPMSDFLVGLEKVTTDQIVEWEQRIAEVMDVEWHNVDVLSFQELA